MRILLVTDWMSNPGGAETYMMALRRALLGARDKVRLLACGAEFGDEVKADERVFGSDSFAAQTLLQVVNPFAVARLRRVLGDFCPDVTFVSQFQYHLSPAVLSPLRAVPTVVSITDYKTICPIGSKLLPDGSLCQVTAGYVCHENGCVGFSHWLRDQPRYALLRSGLKHVDRLVCPSPAVQAELAANGLKADLVPLGVEPASAGFRRTPASDPVFAYCGRLSREKGAAVLLRAFAILRGKSPSARLRIVGDGPDRASLESLAVSLGIAGAVHFSGAVPNDRVEETLADAWALIAPSLWAEPFGLVALEAISRGLPVIASATGGFLEIVEPGVSGVLIPSGDERALADSLLAFAQRRVFPTHVLPPEVVARVQETRSVERHCARLRSIFSDVAARRELQ